MNLNDIRVATRTQLDLDETDLPNELLNIYVQEGYDRIIDTEARWPFFETSWDVFVPAGQGWGAAPPNARQVETVLGPAGRLDHVDLRYLQEVFAPSGTPSGSGAQVWTQFNDRLLIQPTLSSDVTYTVYGFRAPRDWIAEGASAVVDADVRLHIPIVWYCCSLGYAQQEDEVLEQTYMNRFREAADLACRSVMTPWTGAPKLLNSRSRRARTGVPGGPSSLAILPPSPPEQITSAIGGTP